MKITKRILLLSLFLLAGIGTLGSIIALFIRGGAPYLPLPFCSTSMLIAVLFAFGVSPMLGGGIISAALSIFVMLLPIAAFSLGVFLLRGHRILGCVLCFLPLALDMIFASLFSPAAIIFDFIMIAVVITLAVIYKRSNLLRVES